jgi:DUF1009 family protein
MAGFLSNVFADDRSDMEQSQGSVAAEIGQALDVEQTAAVSHSETVSYETADGTTHSWSNSQDVTLTVGLDATLGLAAEVTGGTISDEAL